MQIVFVMVHKVNFYLCSCFDSFHSFCFPLLILDQQEHLVGISKEMKKIDEHHNNHHHYYYYPNGTYHKNISVIKKTLSSEELAQYEDLKVHISNGNTTTLTTMNDKGMHLSSVSFFFIFKSHYIILVLILDQ